MWADIGVFLAVVGLLTRLGDGGRGGFSVLSTRGVLIIGIGVRRARVGGRRGVSWTGIVRGDVEIDRTVLEKCVFWI